MDKIIEYFDSVNIDLQLFATGCLVLLAGTLVLSLLGRFVFGKKSMLNHAISSGIAILFIYAITVVLQSFGAQLGRFVAPLPFVAFENNCLVFLDLGAMHYTDLFAQVLSMIILAFLVNLAEGWLSKGEHFFSWLFYRVATVAIGYGMHLVVNYLFYTFLPADLTVYAPVILLGLLLLLMATGILKILIGALISTVNPIIGGLYTFFFANMIGKKITKAVLTTGILAGLLFILRSVGILAIIIAKGALAAYIPFLILLIMLWYLVNKIL